MKEIVLGYYGSYEVEHVGNICHVKLYDLMCADEDANYKVSIINGTLFIFQYDKERPNDLFAEHAISNFDAEFMGDYAGM